MRTIKESEAAIDDIASIHDFISHGIPSSADPVAADRVLDAVEATYRHLAEFPHKTRIARRDLFKTTVSGFNQYLIIYRFDDKTVEILRVFRADLDWTRIIAEL